MSDKKDDDRSDNRSNHRIRSAQKGLTKKFQCKYNTGAKKETAGVGPGRLYFKVLIISKC